MRRPGTTSAPASPSWLAGVLFFATLAAGACERVPGVGAKLELDGETIALPAGVEIIDVRLAAPEGQAAFAPERIQADPGDVLRFRATALGTHALRFDDSRLTPDQRTFLERTNQLASPPLVDSTAVWIVSLEGAPPGEYPLAAAPHPARGVVVVR